MTDFNKVYEDAKEVLMPFECWDKLNKESSFAYSAFCIFRDMGAERSIKKAVELSFGENEKTEKEIEKRYGVWRTWAVKWRWKERVEAYDRHIDKKKQTKFRERIEKQIEKQFEVTEKLLDKASMKLDIMTADELTQDGVIYYTNTAIKWQRDFIGNNSASTEVKQDVFSFEPQFQGL